MLSLFFAKRKARKRNGFAHKSTSKQKALFHAFSTLRDKLALNFAHALARHGCAGSAPKRNDFALQVYKQTKISIHALSTLRDQLALNFDHALARRSLRGLRAEKKCSQKKRFRASSPQINQRLNFTRFPYCATN